MKMNPNQIYSIAGNAGPTTPQQLEKVRKYLQQNPEKINQMSGIPEELLEEFQPKTVRDRTKEPLTMEQAFNGEHQFAHVNLTILEEDLSSLGISQKNINQIIENCCC